MNWFVMDMIYDGMIFLMLQIKIKQNTHIVMAVENNFYQNFYLKYLLVQANLLVLTAYSIKNLSH